MDILEIKYSHEFISNKIVDELILFDIEAFKILEEKILNDIENIFNFKVGKNRNINTLSGGQRSITYLVTLTYIKEYKKIKVLNIALFNILQSLSQDFKEKILNLLNTRGIYVIK